MSKVAIQGAATGTGVFTLASPATNTDRTLTLPDEAGTVITTASYVAGIAEADMWRLSSSFTTTSGVEDLTTNFERVDEPSFAKIGTGVSESSGAFSFPSTGLYSVQMAGYFNKTSDLNYVGLQLSISQDGGSTFNVASYTFQSLDSAFSSKYAGTLNVESFVNVTNTSNLKVKFQTYTTGVVDLKGSTTLNATWFKFIRLGDSQ